jgi:protein subunit release factor B
VNKVNTQVQLRLKVVEATWIGPVEVRERLMAQQSNKINKDGFLVLSSQEHRTQPQNRAAVLDKLRSAVLQAWPRPVQRKVRTGISQKTKQERIDYKRRRSQVKEARRSVDF